MDYRVKNAIEQSDIFADKAIDELSKTPPNWDQLYEYIEMIGTRMAEAVDVVYKVTTKEELRDEYINYIEKENERIKKRIVSFMKYRCK